MFPNVYVSSKLEPGKETDEERKAAQKAQLQAKARAQALIFRTLPQSHNYTNRATTIPTEPQLYQQSHNYTSLVQGAAQYPPSPGLRTTKIQKKVSTPWPLDTRGA